MKYYESAHTINFMKRCTNNSNVCVNNGIQPAQYKIIHKGEENKHIKNEYRLKQQEILIMKIL